MEDELEVSPGCSRHLIGKIVQNYRIFIGPAFDVVPGGSLAT